MFHDSLSKQNIKKYQLTINVKKFLTNDDVQYFRSSYRRCYLKRRVPNNFAKFTGRYLSWWGLQLYQKRDCNIGVFQWMCTFGAKYFNEFITKFELSTRFLVNSVRNLITAQKMKLSIKDFYSKCDQICSFLRIWSH